jgi:putative DNA-binding protein
MPEARPARQTLDQLRDLQRLTFAAIRHPLSPAHRLQKNWTDGRPMRDVLAEFIKPNDRLTSAQRVEIYAKSYWFRVLDCLYDDYPGLLAILGEKKFYRLRVAYLDTYPSRSFTLRNLGSRLAQFIAERPGLTAPHQELALDMARFEWAQVEAFDGPALPPISIEDLAGKDPAKLRVGLQPYITLLKLSYPLDDFVIAVKKSNRALRSEASNAVDEQRTAPKPRKVKLPNRAMTHLVVHRFNNDLYYKRLEPEALALLESLRDGATLLSAINRCGIDPQSHPNWSAQLQEWFKTWMELGWFCKRRPTRSGRA